MKIFVLVYAPLPHDEDQFLNVYHKYTREIPDLVYQPV